MHKLLRKPSPAMIVACLALFTASTGTSIAARHYLITSTKQIKPSVIKKLHGAKGAKGAAGVAGAAGAAGATNVVIRYGTGAYSYDFSGAVASCAAGERATGGGVDWVGSGVGLTVFSGPTQYPAAAGVTPTGWEGSVWDLSGSYSVAALVWVICAAP